MDISVPMDRFSRHKKKSPATMNGKKNAACIVIATLSAISCETSNAVKAATEVDPIVWTANGVV